MRMTVEGTAAQRLHRTGIAWMLATTFLFVLMDTLVKLGSQTFETPQLLWARYVFHVAFLALLLRRRLPAVLHSKRLGLQVVRSALLFATTGFFFYGLSKVPLASATAIMMVAPLLVTALAVPLLGEVVGLRRWASVLVGFGGALLIVRPGTGMVESGAVFPLAAACTYACYQIATRVVSHSDPPITTLLYTAVVGAVIASFVVPYFWTPPSLLGWCHLAAIGLIGGLGHYALIRAFHVAPANLLAPFGYTNLLWATLLGFVVFGNLPDQATVAGAAVIIASGLYVLHRERVRRPAVGRS
jgi:drug/metabolite transporter (DMT)-like permease